MIHWGGALMGRELLLRIWPSVEACLVIGFVNQAFYGFCFEGYCLAAAFPKVLILALIVTVVLYLLTKGEGEEKE